MSWIEQKKRQFIRWYGGYFVNDPYAETFTFGLYRSRGAMRLSRLLYRVRRMYR